MPGTDMSLEQLRQYRGADPCPADFGAFWEAVTKRLEENLPQPEISRVESHTPEAEYYLVSIPAPDGVRLRAKLVRPAGKTPVPGVLLLHDYPGASRSWFHLTRYPAAGMAVLAPDSRGQGGCSENGAAGPGPTAYGPLFNGLEGAVEDLYLYKLICDAVLWGKVMSRLEGLDSRHLTVCGDGQGGGLAIAAAALNPGFAKCCAHYPMLCDYRRVWERDFDTGAYEGLRYFFRWHDPLHEREEEIFGKLAYVDVKNFAPMVRAATLLSTGLQDTVSPPSAQFAVFNALTEDKRHLVYPKHGHELNNFYENELLKFLLLGWTGEEM